MGTEKPLSASAPPLAVRAQGSDRTLPAGPSYTIGRDPKSDIVVDEDRVSWQHAVLKLDSGSWVLEDTGSTNGTFVGSQKVQKIILDGETTVRLGHPVDGPELACSTGAPPRPATVLASRPVMPAGGRGGSDGPAVADRPAMTGGGTSTASHREPSVIRPLPTKVLRIGRAPDSDIVISDLSVSRNHAELRRTASGYQIVDLDSHNGTFVNGQQIGSAPLTEGDIVGIGPSTFRLSGSELQEFVDTGDVSLVARDLTVTLGNGKVLLDHVTFPLGERCLLGIIGPSGAGKSTLLGALTGMRPANGGSVLYDDRDLYANYAELRHRIGLVPQENILHTQLTARRALRYAAELRFPRDTSKAERNRRVDEVLGELSLTPHAETRTDRLSGGQQKRVNVALELMTKPSLLFLDEPTSGLDPGLDKSVMEMMAGLAKDGRTVIVVTHSVANLDICDRLLVLVPGGKVAYFGPPQDGLKHFGKPGWAEVFQSFDAEPQRDWAGEYRRSAWYQQYVLSAVDGRGPSAAPRQIPPAPASKNRLAQFSTLCRRYLSVIASDRVYLGLLAGAPIVLGAVILAIPAQYGLGPAPPPASHSQHQGASPSAKPKPSGSHKTSHPSPQAVGAQQVGRASAAAQASPSASAPASAPASAQGSASASAAPASAPASGNASAPASGNTSAAAPAPASAAAPAPASAQGSAKASARGSAKGSPQPSGHPTAATNAATPPPANDAASSLLLILVICACFAGAFNAVRELVKERSIYSRERAAGLSTASYLGSKLAVLGFISGVQAAIMVLIGLATRKLPPSGSLLHAFPLVELILALALLAVVSMALGLFISASVNTSEKTMPILMVVVVVEVVLTGGVFAIAGKVGLEQIAWLSPSRWGYALTASTANLNKIFPPAPGSVIDHLWDHTGHQWLMNMAALAALGLVFAFLAWWQLLRQGPARRG
ncbi:MAG TPA: FHA domain-containing protein [Streptosporangiaceae bacterium]|nr:FHA domain-containing protein [Streptosporangiaceae bacterium]